VDAIAGFSRRLMGVARGKRCLCGDLPGLGGRAAAGRSWLTSEDANWRGRKAVGSEDAHGFGVEPRKSPELIVECRVIAGEEQKEFESGTRPQRMDRFEIPLSPEASECIGVRRRGLRRGLREGQQRAKYGVIADVPSVAII
jgi:hypothetical protein